MGLEDRSNRGEEFKELGGYDIGWIIPMDTEILKHGNRSSGKEKIVSQVLKSSKRTGNHHKFPTTRKSRQ